MKYLLVGTVLITGASLALAQNMSTTSGSSGGGQLTTLIVSPNANGVGVRVVDQTSGQQVQGVNGNQQVAAGRGDDDDMDEQVVAGLLEWLDKKKKKKKDKKNRKDKNKDKGKDKKDEEEEEKNNDRPTERPTERPEERPTERPEEPPQDKEREKKEIHIHIHIEKKDNNHGKKHDKHDKHGGGNYEDYHEGHYDHDKHYHGKHSWPLLGHHFNWDHGFMAGGGGGGGFGGSNGHGNGNANGYGDDFGYESKKLNNYVIERKPIVVQRPVLVKKEG